MTGTPHDKYEERFRFLEAHIEKLESKLNEQQCNGTREKHANFVIEENGVEIGENSKQADESK